MRARMGQHQDTDVQTTLLHYDCSCSAWCWWSPQGRWTGRMGRSKWALLPAQPCQACKWRCSMSDG